MRVHLLLLVAVVGLLAVTTAAGVRRRGVGTQVSDELGEAMLRKISKHLGRRAADDIPDVLKSVDGNIDEFLRRLARESGVEAGEAVTEAVLKAAAKKALGELSTGKAISDNTDMLIRAVQRKLKTATSQLAGDSTEKAVKYLTDFELEVLREVAQRKKQAPFIPRHPRLGGGYYDVAESNRLAEFYRKVAKNEKLTVDEATEIERLVKMSGGVSSETTAFERKLRAKALESGAADQARDLVVGTVKSAKFGLELPPSSTWKYADGSDVPLSQVDAKLRLWKQLEEDDIYSILQNRESHEFLASVQRECLEPNAKCADWEIVFAKLDAKRAGIYKPEAIQANLDALESDLRKRATFDNEVQMDYLLKRFDALEARVKVEKDELAKFGGGWGSYEKALEAQKRLKPVQDDIRELAKDVGKFSEMNPLRREPVSSATDAVSQSATNTARQHYEPRADPWAWERHTTDILQPGANGKAHVLPSGARGTIGYRGGSFWESDGAQMMYGMGDKDFDRMYRFNKEIRERSRPGSY